MSDSVLFKDLSKSATDLLTKEFWSPKDNIDRKFEFTSKRDSNGVNFVTSLARKVDEEKGLTTVVGTLNPKLKFDAHKLEASLVFDTENKIEGEVSLNERLVPGLKNTLKLAGGKDRLVNTSLEYKHQYGTLTGAADIWNQKDSPKFQASALLNLHGFYFGGAAEYQLAQPKHEWTLLHAAGGYKGSNYTVTVGGKQTKDLKKKKETRGLVGNLHYDVKDQGLSVAAQLEYDLAAKENNIEVTIAAQKKLNDGQTTLKGKYDTKGKVGLSFVHQLNQYAKASIYGEVNTIDLTPAGKHKLGFGLSYNE